ncbi:TM2 domain-containing protein 3 isoform X2 [Sinocyclocheilus anshuiensis]|uniref:TM2 domain-containing protein 3 isoform X2 n=1 Tax=Sinocyclocheilus anshuiensis TaxID=1608454 RepID=UPI0007BA33BE|nr:PREDICTED: TM2 domain-containing protein 3-like isoform X2 [Sinocyclocheilus anshuiensis]
MTVNGPKRVFERGRNIMSSYVMLLLLLLDIYSTCAIAYLSSPHVGQEPPYTAQQSPVMTSPVALTSSSAVTDNDLSKCPSGGLCSRLPADCIICAFHHNCSYGRPTSITCRAKAGVQCVVRECSDVGSNERSQPQQNFSMTLDCRFCWQLDPSQYRCSNSTSCMTVSCPRRRYNASCEVLEHVHCLGKRVFQKRLFCNWTGGYKWSTALALSIALGGFGADRFYLGQWREGLGKLFSFGGLGIWTLIDVLLIGVGYVGPADGSLYI